MSRIEASKAQRLDQYVTGQLPTSSRATAAKLIDRGGVLVNGQPQLKASYRLRTDDVVEIQYDPTAVKAEALTLPILYEDQDCVVINKSAGVLTHSKGAFNPEPTVATWLAARSPAMTGERAGIVHRLDRGTSGVMICAKTPEALGWLQKQFSERKVKKTYVALVSGQLDETRAIIDMPIERNPRRPQTFRVGRQGKAAVTEYQVIKTAGALSLLELRPTTGRTHQLRVHLKHLHHPILGDKLYGGASAPRLFLHAKELELTLPNRQRQTFRAPVPREFAEQLTA
jgi:23S rRNA pseudouridine1911/1915/1917 synthase